MYIPTLSFYFIFFFCVLRCQCESNNDSFEWKSFVQTSNENFIISFLPNYVNFQKDIIDNKLISAKCSNEIELSMSALKYRQSWAVKLFNSWGKFMPSGTFRGTLTDFGDYDQCLGIGEENISQVIASQYCLVDICLPMPRPMPKQHNLFHKSSVLPQTLEQYFGLTNENVLHLTINGSMYRDLEDISSIFYYVYVQIGICLPSGCNQNDTQIFLNSTFQKYGLKLGKFSCNQKIEKLNFNSIQLFAISFLVIAIFLSAIGSIYDSFFCANGKWTSLLWFSPQRNITRLFNFRVKANDDELGCIHGLRVVTICLVIVGHTLVWNNTNMFRDTFSVRERLTEIVPQFIYGSQLTVDTFFFMSGLLTSYVTLKFTGGQYDQFNWFTFLVLRYLRLTPQLATFTLLTFVIPSLYDGPVWRGHISIVDKCYHNWWHNLVYMQNWIDVQNICTVHTWFLAVDMQLHWLSLIPMIVLLKNRQIGIALLKMLILVCILTSSLLIYLKKLPPGAIRTSQSDFLDENGMPSEYLAFVYKPWLHSFVFFIGFLFGDYIVNNSKCLKQIEFKPCKKYLLWSLSLCGFVFSIYGTYPWLHGRHYDPLASALIYPLTLLTWTFGLTLAIWLCVTKNGGFIGTVLSNPQLRPLSRMTYSVYLTHVWVVWASNGSRRELINLNAHSLMIYCAGIIVCSYFVAFVFAILFESPLINALEHWKCQLMEYRRCQRKSNEDEKILSHSNRKTNETNESFC